MLQQSSVYFLDWLTLNMFRALLCPLSGEQDCLIMRVVMSATQKITTHYTTTTL
jgi:hypothetical protein